jgi:hypothetical protein
LKPIRILNLSFEPQGEIDDYESFVLNRRFYSYGEFELHISLNKQHTDKLVKGNIIILQADGHKTGIIRHREINLDEKGEVLTVKGWMLDGILKQRLTVPGVSGYDRINGDAETVMKYYINNHCVAPADTNRAISQLMIATNQNRGVSTPWQTRYENLADVIQQIGEFCDIGHEIWLDILNKRLVFDVIPGRDLTTGQSVLPFVMFSTEFDNIASQHYVDSDLGYCNVGYAGGKGEEDQRLVLQVGSGTGIERSEVFLDLSNSEDATELAANGNQAMVQYQPSRTLEGAVINNTFVYGKDFDLGDKVTAINKKWGVTLDTRITEVKEIIEASGVKIEVVFGNLIPDLKNEMKKLNKPIG